MKRMRKDRHYAFYLTPPTFRITIDCGIERVGKVAEESICKKILSGAFIRNRFSSIFSYILDDNHLVSINKISSIFSYTMTNHL